MGKWWLILLPDTQQKVRHYFDLEDSFLKSLAEFLRWVNLNKRMVEETNHLQILVMILWWISLVVHLRLVTAFHPITHFSSIFSGYGLPGGKGICSAEQKWMFNKEKPSLVLELTRIAIEKTNRSL